MEFALILRELTRRRWLVAIGVLVAAAAAVLSVYRVEGHKLKPRGVLHSAASTQVLVDSSSSVIANLGQSFEPLAARALVYANFMTSPVVLNLIGRHAGLSGGQIYAAGPVSAQEPRVEQEPTAVKRNIEITGETKPYRLNFESQPTLPTITINSQAPTTTQAIALANAAALGMTEYVAGIEKTNNVPPGLRVVIRQLGPATGGVANAGIRKSLAVLAFVGVFVLWCVLVLVASRFRQAWRATSPVLVGAEESRDADRGDADDSEDTADRPEKATRWDIHAAAQESPPFNVESPREDDRPEDDRPVERARSVL